MVDRPKGDGERPSSADGEAPPGEFHHVADAAEQFTTGQAEMDGGKRRRLLGRAAVSMVKEARSMRLRGGIAGVMAGILEGAVPHLRVRDLETLRTHHHGLTGEALADSLVEHASRASALVGAAGGAL